MKKTKLISIFSWLLTNKFLLITFFLVMLPYNKAEAFCNQIDTPGTSLNSGICPVPSTGGHTGITEDALPFLRSEISADITDENILVQDTVNAKGPLAKPFVHFDNSLFVEGISYINTQYSDPRSITGAGGVIAELDPTSPEIYDALDEWGQLLHTAQDFYAHSNWVDYDTRNIPIFDQGTGSWTVPTPYSIIDRGGEPLILIEGKELPQGWTVSKSTIQDLTRGITVTVPSGSTIPAGQYKGLISGAYPDAAASNTPLGAVIEHGNGKDSSTNTTTLNKDSYYRANYDAAYDAAKRQTQNEWCRLLHLTKSKYGLKGASIPMAYFVDPNKGSPHPKGTACDDPTPATQSISVSIESIKVLDDQDFIPQYADLNFTFVLYTNDFTRSIRNEITGVSGFGSSMSEADIPIPLTIGLNDPTKLVITLQAWDDDDEILNIPIFNGKYNEGIDDLLEGVTLDFSKGYDPGFFIVKSDDLEVCLKVEQVGGKKSAHSHSQRKKQCQEIPEPNSALSLLLFGAMGIGSLLKRKLHRKK